MNYIIIGLLIFIGGCTIGAALICMLQVSHDNDELDMEFYRELSKKDENNYKEEGE